MAAGARITEVLCELFRVPLREVLVDAIHGDHTHFELVTCRVTLESGLVGTGYTYTGGKGGRAILALLRHELRPYLLGRDARCVEQLWHGMAQHVHYVARGGIDVRSHVPY